MAPTLNEIEANPTILCEYLQSRGLLENYVETESMAKLYHQAECVNSFVWGILKNLCQKEVDIIFLISII